MNTTPQPDVICYSAQRRRMQLRLLYPSLAIGLGGTFLCGGLLAYLEKSGTATELAKNFAAVGLLICFFGMFAVPGVFEFLSDLQAGKRKKRLTSAGVHVDSVIVSAKETGGSVNDAPQLELLLRVTLPGKEPYLARHCQVIPKLFLSRIVPGRTVPSEVDPSDPRSMLLNLERWETEP